MSSNRDTSKQIWGWLGKQENEISFLHKKVLELDQRTEARLPSADDRHLGQIRRQDDEIATLRRKLIETEERTSRELQLLTSKLAEREQSLVELLEQRTAGKMEELEQSTTEKLEKMEQTEQRTLVELEQLQHRLELLETKPPSPEVVDPARQLYEAASQDLPNTMTLQIGGALAGVLCAHNGARTLREIFANARVVLDPGALQDMEFVVSKAYDPETRTLTVDDTRILRNFGYRVAK